MSIKALSDYTQYAKYARFIKEKKRRETWNEQVERVAQMHRDKLGDKLELIQEDFDFAIEMLRKKNILGSQRALQFGGHPILSKNAKIYNCCASYVDRVDFFKECLYLLMCGCGAGFSVQKHHIEKLPTIKKRDNGKEIFVISDSIEGWADAIGVLMQSYFRSEDNYVLYGEESGRVNYSGKVVTFDYSLIRPQGSKISWGGIAPGPSGLENALNKITELMESVLGDEKEATLRPIDAYDIIMHQSDAVLSGGIRRSATICLFSPEDEEMATAKTGDWFVKNPQRGRSNNSAVLLRDEITKEEFSRLMKSVKDFGEPGFIWADSKETLFNPCCVSGDTITKTDVGPKKVIDLIGKKFNAVVNGKTYESISDGFFYSGKKDLYKLELKQGFESIITDDHRILTENRGWVEAKGLTENDQIVINNHENSYWDGRGNRNQGWLIGSLLGDGTFSRDSALLEYWGEEAKYMPDHANSLLEEEGLSKNKKIKEYQCACTFGGVEKKRISSVELKRLAESFGITRNKIIDDNIYESSSEFVKGFLSGWFDADGSVQGNLVKGASIRLSSSLIDNLKKAQILLLNLGIYSKIYKNRCKEGYRKLPNGLGELTDYYCKANHELVISNDSIVKFNNIIGFSNRQKNIRLNKLISSYKRTPNKTKFIGTLKSFEYHSTEDVYDCTINTVNAFDANGLYVHNCEIGFYNYDDEGQSGWGFCNLTELNGKKMRTPEQFYEGCRAAAILGTIQATYNQFDYLSEATHNIVSRDALLGVSITGMMDNYDITFDTSLQRKGAKILLDTNEKIAEKLDINPCMRAGCIKPSGTASCILGTSSGIHPQHAKRYIRRVQANKLEFPIRHFAKLNPLAVEESVWSNNNTDLVVSFLCEVPDGAKTKNQIGGVDLLEHVKKTQQNWVEHSTRHERNNKVTPWLRHNVSNTINVKVDEWDDVENYIYKNRKWFAGISLLPASGDLDYPQAPFVTVLSEREIVQEYGNGSVLVSGLVVDGLAAFDDDLWKACDCALGIGEELPSDINEPIEPTMPVKNGYSAKVYATKLIQYSNDLNNFYSKLEEYNKIIRKMDWVRRFKQFAERYCESKYKKCSHMVKHVYVWKQWLDLKRSYIDIDWSQVVEDDYELDVSTISGEACSSGKCELGDLGVKIEENLQGKNK